MKIRNLFLAGSAAAVLALAAQAQDNIVPIESAVPNGEGGVTLHWFSTPDATYHIKGVPSLIDSNAQWKVEGIASASGWSVERSVDLSTNDIMFYRVEQMDSSGPVFEFISPAQDSGAVPTNAEIRIAITDPSGVSTTNLGMYVGSAWHAHDSAGMAWDGEVLCYTGGNLGNPGDTVPVWATATDLLGNPGRCETSLLVLASDLETVTAEEGSQTVPFVVIGAVATSVSDLVSSVSGSTGITSASIASTEAEGKLWIEAVTTNTLVFGFTMDAWQLLAVGQLWASDNPDNIFYRRITVVGEPENGSITVETAEATLADFFVGGSFNSEDGGDWREYNVEDPSPSATARRRLVRPRVGGSTSRSFSTNGVISSAWLNGKISEKIPGNVLKFDGDLGHWDVGAGFSVAADFGILKRKFNSCDLAVNGSVRLHLNPKLVATTNAAYSNKWEWTLAEVNKTFGGTIGPVPIWVDLGVKVPAELIVQAEATNASVAAVIDIRRELDYHWKLSDDVWKQVGSGNPGWVIAETNFTYEIEGSAGVRVAVKPTVTIKVYSLIGANGWVEPYLECNALGRLQGQNLQAPDFYYLLTAYAGLNAGVGMELLVWNDDWGTLPSKTFSPLRKQLLYLEGTNTPPRIKTQPESCTSGNGETVMFSVDAEGTWPLKYAWYHKGKDTGRRDPYITLRADAATAGDYYVRVSNGYGTNDSATARLTVVTNIPVIGAWRFDYQWAGNGGYTYLARIYANGTMHDTSPNDNWWNWYFNGNTIRFETRGMRDGQEEVWVCRGARGEENKEFMSGTMLSPSGRTGTWSMVRLHDDPDVPEDDVRPGLRSLRPKAVAAGAVVGP